ncbi:hypothetical protein O3P69_004174 [Scylla paramamosain]|uniref:SWIM-type domain-containing protein n=1 Tax=Scylla paramamosain TaxID=85552 RepID=A0AAW0UFF0_SCYPA
MPQRENRTAQLVTRLFNYANGTTLEFNFDVDGFKNIIVDQSEKNVIQIRTNASTEERAMQWLQVYMKKFKTSLNVVRKYNVTKKLHMRHIYQCQHGRKRSQGIKKIYSGCTLSVDIKIKAITKYNKMHDKYVQDYPCIVNIIGEHNHSTGSASALNQLKLLQETKKDFAIYFDAGMTAAQARQIHQERKMFDLSDMANNSINPKPRVVNYLRQLWVADNHGSLEKPDMLFAIKKYAENHPSSKIAWDEDDNRFVVVLATEFMLRIHKEFREAGEVVFVDTTSHVNQIKTAVTPLLCASPAGAMPLGVILSSSQDELSYTKGFGLLKDVLGDVAFFGKNYPDCFMTDNCKTEKKALCNVWPHAKQYICIFHLLQQVWKWLCTSGCVKKEDRPNMMSVAQRLVYTKTDSEFTEVWKTYLSREDSLKYRSYTKYLSKLVEQQQFWSSHHRTGTLPHGHNTSNFAESTMCIIKDIVHNRCKGFNTCHLLIYMNEVFDSYMKRRLLDLALGRKDNCAKLHTINETFSIQRDDEQYLVSSSSHTGVVYVVDMKIGLCECPQGQMGDICKHQVACAESKSLELLQAFTDSPERRQWLASVALGKKTPPLEFLVCEKMTPVSSERCRAEIDDTVPGSSKENNDTVPRGTKEINDTVPGGSEEINDTVPGGSKEIDDAVPGGNKETDNTVPGGSKEIDDAVPGGSEETDDTVPGGSEEINDIVPGGIKEIIVTGPGANEANNQQSKRENVPKMVLQPHPALAMYTNSLIEDIRKYVDEYGDKDTQSALDSFQKKLRAVRSSNALNALFV